MRTPAGQEVGVRQFCFGFNVIMQIPQRVLPVIPAVKAVAFLIAFAAAAALGAEPNGSDEILLGMSTSLSGPTADLGRDMRQGVLAGLERVNRSGGMHGRHLNLVALDDGYEPSRTGPNMRKLLEAEHVLAVIGNVGTPTAIVSIPIANEQKTLLFACFSGAGVLRKTPPERYVINYRASYAEETAAMIDAMMQTGLVRCDDIALFTQRDGYGDAGFDGAVTALKRHGLKDERQVLHVGYERNTLAVEDALATILYAEHLPRAIVMVGAYAPCAKFIKLADEAGLKALFLNVSFVGSNPLASELGPVKADVIVTQVVPHPDGHEAPILSEYQSDLKALDPSIRPGFGSLEGYVASRVLIRALDTLKGEFTRERLIDALERLGTFDLGLGAPLQLNAKEHQASHAVWPTILRQGAFVQFQWPDIAALLERTKTP